MSCLCRQLPWFSSHCLTCGVHSSNLFCFCFVFFFSWIGWSLPYTCMLQRLARGTCIDCTQLMRPFSGSFLSWIPSSLSGAIDWSGIHPLGLQSRRTADFFCVFQLPWTTLKLWPPLRRKLKTWEIHPMLCIFSKFQLLPKTNLLKLTFQSPWAVFCFLFVFCPKCIVICRRVNLLILFQTINRTSIIFNRNNVIIQKLCFLCPFLKLVLDSGTVYNMLSSSRPIYYSKNYPLSSSWPLRLFSIFYTYKQHCNECNAA